MPLCYQIDVLRRRFWDGDESARDALQSLLRRYVGVIVRRAARRTVAPLNTFRGMRNHQSDAGRETGFPDRGTSLAPETICRRLCDDLLRSPPEGKAPVRPARGFDTVRAVLRTVIG